MTLVRPFAPYDLRLEIAFPSSDPIVFEHVTGQPNGLERVKEGLRNLKAFDYPFDIEIPVVAAYVGTLGATIAHLTHLYT